MAWIEAVALIIIFLTLCARIDLMISLWFQARAWEKAHRNDPPLRPMTERERLMCDPRWNNELGRLID